MTLATRITLTRVGFIPVLAALIFCYSPDREWTLIVAFWLYVFASISDWVDGYLARHWNQRSELGARLDPLADKLLIDLGFIFVAVNPHFSPGVPMWFPPLLLLRDSWIILAAIRIYRRHGRIVAAARPLGKVTTTLMMVTFGGALLQVGFTHELVYASVAFGFLSGFDYILFGRENLTAKEAG